MHKKLTKLIYRSFDDTLTPKEKSRLDQALIESDELQRIFEETRKLRDAATSPGGSFGPMFAERVIRTIKEKNAQIQEDFFGALNYMFRRVALAGAVAVIIMFSVIVLKNDTSASVADYAVTQMTLDDLVDPTLTASLEDIL